MKVIYWTIPVFLFIAQLTFTLNSNSQIRYEELAEGVRNPFWLSQAQVYDGTSSNVGWYGSLLVFYNLFGFSLETAKLFKLTLYLGSIVCLSLVLKRYVKDPWLPLLVIGLSPTWLYYNTSLTSHGIDLLYFPIVLFLILGNLGVVGRLGGWALAMLAWMSYPTFIFYLPVLVLAHLRGEGKVTSSVHLGSVISFLAPLFLAFIFIKNRSLLVYDESLGSGIFRGAGSFSLDGSNFAESFGGVMRDLSLRGQSYHFDLNQGEFSLFFPILAVLLVLSLGFKISSRWVKLGLVMFFVTLILPSFTIDPSGQPGIRRYTPFLAAFYALFVLVWFHLRGESKVSANTHLGGVRKIGVGVMSLLLIHHLIVYPINLMHLKDPSPEAYPIWFNTAETPQKSLDNLAQKVQSEDLKLICTENGQPFYCRYAEVYSAVAGSCTWNDLDCRTILGYDLSRGEFIPLSVDLWLENYLEH